MAQYCPDMKDCLFYKNWKEQTGKDIIDIIFGEGFHYDCLALRTLNEKKIPMSNELKKRLSDLEQIEFKCFHITLLNK